jgi:hypothetical protein
MKLDLKFLTRTAILIGLTLGFQALALPQPITGPVVNAVLFVSTGIIGMLSGALIGLITPWVAFAVGTMKLAPAVPVIIAGNLAIPIVFGLLHKRNRYVAALAAAVTKYVVMFLGMNYLTGVLNLKIPAAVVATLTTVQLWTALGGAVLGVAVIASLQMFAQRPAKDGNE